MFYLSSHRNPFLGAYRMVLNRKKVINSRKCLWKTEMYGQLNSIFLIFSNKYGTFYEMNCNYSKMSLRKISKDI